MTGQVRQADFVGVQTRKHEDGTHEITIAANNIARDNLDLDIDSLKLDNYLRNPVVLWAHDMSRPPIGRAIAVTKADGKLTARFEFAKGVRFAEEIESLWNQGILRAASIRWDGGDVSFPDTGPLMRFTGSELIEWSIVPVGSDPDALRSAARSLQIPMRRLFVPQRAEGDMPDEPAGETPPDDQNEEPTLEERLAALDAREAAFDEEIEKRVKALEGDDEEEPEDDGSSNGEETGGEPDEEERAIANVQAEVAELLAALQEKN